MKELLELLPHGPGLRLLNEILEWTPDGLTAGVVVSSNILYSAATGTVCSSLTVEYIGQAVAAHMTGFGTGGRAEPGFIVRMRNVLIKRSALLPAERLVVRVITECDASPTASYTGIVERQDGGGVVADGNFIIHVPERPWND